MKWVWIAVLIIWLLVPLFWRYIPEKIKTLMALAYPYLIIIGGVLAGGIAGKQVKKRKLQ
ncbi:hypothetical protein [Thermococcus barophilus]|uniref:Uncharacterized protein n=1 Tax=Thermococcus barophilus TaxID=55802 RepID=A0A0S1XC62_THEBA|nr:hypothetical protein [Thermococcus barophilus]ALM75397.1 hypothetical protein TBCH5v1_1480 [Thermococcus barophilus]